MRRPGKKKGKRLEQVRCPYCGAPAIYRSADGIYRDNSSGAMLYVCANYPACDSYVRVHEGTRIPVGSMAGPELRKLRKEAHDQFGMLYRSGTMSRKDAYCWLADTLGLPMSEAHIGRMKEYYCRQVIIRCRELMEIRQGVGAAGA